MIYNNKFIFNNRNKKIPIPSYLPLAITFTLLSMCLIIVIPPVVSGIDVKMPSLHTQPIEIYDDFKYITLYVNNDKIVINNSQITDFSRLGDFIKNKYKKYNNMDIYDTKIFIKADKTVSYNSLISLLDMLNSCGYKNITLVGVYAGGNNNIFS